MHLRCAAEAVTPGEAISVTAWHDRAPLRSFDGPAFRIQPLDGATGAWTMARTQPGSAWSTARYDGTFVARTEGRVRLEAVLGVGDPVATCEVRVVPG